jgi:hypothetical protein
MDIRIFAYIIQGLFLVNPKPARLSKKKFIYLFSFKVAFQVNPKAARLSKKIN